MIEVVVVALVERSPDLGLTGLMYGLVVDAPCGMVCRNFWLFVMRVCREWICGSLLLKRGL